MAEVLRSSTDARKISRLLPRTPAARGGPFSIAAGGYLLAVAAIVAASWHRAQNHFIYPLDDVYINMAVAKNFALHGVWGVSPFEFSSSTSSPLYILVLTAVYRLFGVNRYAPLLLSAGFGLGALYVGARILRSFRVRHQTAGLLAMVLLAPLFAVGALGMEHSLHLLLTLLFLEYFDAGAEQAGTVAGEGERGAALWLIGLITAVMCGVRYEGVLMAAVGTLVLLLRGRYLRAAVVGVSAWVPVGLYAAFSTMHGGYWLPNSVAIKGLKVTGLSLAERLSGLLFVVRNNAVRGPHVPLLAAGLLVLMFPLRRRERRLAGMLAVLAGTALLHVATADVGWAFRYETYLVGAACIVLAAGLPRMKRLSDAWKLGTCLPLAMCLVVLMMRSYLAATLLPEYSRAIFLQQWQMARFLSAAYPGGSVAANDIGAINYLGDLHTLDLVGLANAKVFEAKRDDDFRTELIDELSRDRQVQVAVVYDSWFAEEPSIPVLSGPPLPDSWLRVRRWTVPEKQQLGDRTISWYAVQPAEAASLRVKLLHFEKDLPDAVAVSD